MKIEIITSEFLKSLKKFTMYSKDKNAQVKLIANGNLTLYAFSKNGSGQTSVDCQIKKQGNCIVPLKIIYQIVKLVTDFKIEIELKNDWFIFRFGKTEVTIPTKKLDGMYSVDEKRIENAEKETEDKICEIDKEIFQKAFSFVKDFGCDFLTHLKGFIIQSNNLSCYFLGTDSYQLAKFQMAGNFNKNFKICVPRSSYIELNILLKEEGIVELIELEHNFKIKIGSSFVLLKKDSELNDFDYSQFINMEVKKKCYFEISKKEIVNALKLANRLILQTPRMTFDFIDNELKLKLDSGDVDCNVDSNLPCKTHGFLSIDLQAKQVLKALKLFKNKELEFRFDKEKNMFSIVSQSKNIIYTVISMAMNNE